MRDSSLFAASPTLCRLLEYVVERWLRNDRVAPKEYTVGVEVFHRGEGFDPRFDTIVRAHARRLRERLAQYYLGEGRGDAIRIDMPKGHYVVQVQRVPLSAAAAPRQSGALLGHRHPLVGRQLDLATALEALPGPAARLLTLTGPGDVGKTRLAAEALRRAGVDINFVVEIEVGDGEILRRMIGRRVHLASGRSYHVEFNPPHVPGKDDVTGEPLVQRSDDNEETVKKRIKTYHEQTKPLINYYLSWAASGDPRAPHYVNIYGRGSVNHIRDKMLAAIESHTSRTKPASGK
jgi:adenylate kinase family enzyme